MDFIRLLKCYTKRLRTLNTLMHLFMILDINQDFCHPPNIHHFSSIYCIFLFSSNILLLYNIFLFTDEFICIFPIQARGRAVSKSITTFKMKFIWRWSLHMIGKSNGERISESLTKEFCYGQRNQLNQKLRAVTKRKLKLMAKIY